MSIKSIRMDSRPPSTRMPTGLAEVLNEVGPDERMRDSAYYSNLDSSSKRESWDLLFHMRFE